jgi:hypothetical protein
VELEQKVLELDKRIDSIEKTVTGATVTIQLNLDGRKLAENVAVDMNKYLQERR